MIGLGQQNYLYSLLQRKNGDSSLLTPEFWSIARKLEVPHYKRILALLYNNKIQEAENELLQMETKSN